MESWNFGTILLGFVALLELRTVPWTDATSGFPKNIELCGSSKDAINLQSQGLASSASIVLGPIINSNGPCKLKIVAPRTHVINLQFSEPDPVIKKALKPTTNATDVPQATCKLSVFVSENKRTPVWEGDPCGGQPLEIELLTPMVRLVWIPPAKDGHLIKNKKLVATAVGEGEVCTEKGNFICQKIGWAPKFCISNELVCDGNLNCPKGGLKNDEDETACHGMANHPSWEQWAMEILKTWKPNHSGGINNDWFSNQLQHNGSTNGTNSGASSISKTLLDWKDLKKIEAKNSNGEKITVDNISAALAHYGPWGYLMLGMLICGTVLMFCGLWECCCNHHKPSSESSHHQSAQSTQPTTILVINPQQQDQDSANPLPPNYEDLDQPPSYSTLFPNYKSCQSRNSLAASFVTPDGQIFSSDGANYCAITATSNASSAESGSRNQTVATIDIETVTVTSDSSNSNSSSSNSVGRNGA